jgi:transposase InsO family protein
MKFLEKLKGLRGAEEVEFRMHVLDYGSRHGVKAACDAFRIGRSTWYLWKSKFEKGGRRLEALRKRSRAPRRRRQRVVNPLIERFVIEYRTDPLHYGVGKEAIKPALDRYCRERSIATVSESTIGRMLVDMKRRGLLEDPRKRVSLHGSSGNLILRIKKRSKKQRRGDYQPQEPGDLVQMDSIAYFSNELKRYLITATDLKSGFCFAYIYPRLNSLNARDFFEKLSYVAPFQVKRIQTDNGSEFESHFRRYVESTKSRDAPLVHFHNYPRRPQSNSHVERFNRTVQQQHMHRNEEDLEDVKESNMKLMKYLIWFNTEKPHRSLNKKSPMEYYLSMFVKNRQKSNMLWTLTAA